MFLNRTRIDFLLNVTLLFFAATTLLGQTAPARPPLGATQTSNPVFTIRGRVQSEVVNGTPEILEVKLEKVSALVDQSFLRSDHSFEFLNLGPGTYNVVIKDEEFEDVSVAVDVFGRISQIFYVYIMLTPRRKSGTQAQEWEADDEINNTVSVSLLSKKVPPKALKLYRQSLDLEQKRKYPEAIAKLEHAVSMAPDFYSAQRNLGIDYFVSGQSLNAISSLQSALKLNPNSSKVNFFLGLSFLNTGDLPTAQNHFMQAISLAPEKAGPHYFLGYIYYKQNRLEEAEKNLKKAMEFDKALGSYSRLQLANVYLKQSQLEEAYKQMEIFLKEKPNAQEVSQVMSNLRVLRDILNYPIKQP